MHCQPGHFWYHHSWRWNQVIKCWTGTNWTIRIFTILSEKYGWHWRMLWDCLNITLAKIFQFWRLSLVKEGNMRQWNAATKICGMQGERLWNTGRQYSEVVEWHSTALHSTSITETTSPHAMHGFLTPTDEPDGFKIYTHKNFLYTNFFKGFNSVLNWTNLDID